VERIAGFGYARQGTSRSDPCGAEVATTLGEVMSKKKEYVEIVNKTTVNNKNKVYIEIS